MVRLPLPVRAIERVHRTNPGTAHLWGNDDRPDADPNGARRPNDATAGLQVLLIAVLDICARGRSSLSYSQLVMRSYDAARR